LGNYDTNKYLKSNCSQLPVAPNFIPSYSSGFINSLSACDTSDDSLVCDTGATNTYLKMVHQGYLSNCMPLHNGPKARLPDNTEIQATHRGTLQLHPQLQPSCLVFPHLSNESLLSIGQLCDQGCIAIFNKWKMYVFKDNALILTGSRSPQDGLWKIPFFKEQPRSKTQAINYIITRDKDKIELAQYLHACAFSPAISTFQQCINKGNFLSWPGIENLNFKKLLGTPEATAKGHLDQERANLQSTHVPASTSSPPSKVSDLEVEADLFPDKETNRTNEWMYKICHVEHIKDTYMDLTGRFPHQSSRGHNYILVAYNYDANAILFEPLKNREASSIRDAWLAVHNRYKQNGQIPVHYTMDNETSQLLEHAMEAENVTFEKVPPRQHRRNAAERAIRTFKNHFLAGLATCHPDFPIREWDRLLPQAELTLNLLRNSRINPKLSAWAFLFGNHNFNKVPLVPPGTKVILHSKPDHRASWAYHGLNGWYVGPAPQHYRCLTCYVPQTHKDRVTDTAILIPHHIPLPQTSLDHHLRKAADDIVHLLHKKDQLHIPSPKSTTSSALLELAKILHRDSTPPIKPLPTSTSTISNPPTSEGDSVSASSEGVTAPIPRDKTTITPMHTSNLPKYPSLYPTKIDQNKSSPSSFSPPFTQPTTHYDNDDITVDTGNKAKSIHKSSAFDDLLQQYRHQPKSTPRRESPKLPSKLPPFNIPPLSVPQAKQQSLPKQYPSIRHPMLLRRKRILPTHYTSYRHTASKYLAAQNLIQSINHVYNEEGQRLKVDDLMKLHPTIWPQAVSNEIGRLSRGIRDVVGNNAMEFIPRELIPKNKKVTYANMVCDERPLKTEKFRIRLIVCGDVLD